MERAASQPSAMTMLPNDTTDCGRNRKESAPEEEDDSPVSMRVRNWQEGGPWNHHSRSEARRLVTAWESRALRASYRARTSFWLLESASSKVP